MELTPQNLTDAIEGKLTAAATASLIERLRLTPPQEVSQIVGRAGINITGDGIIVGNNNINIVTKNDFARVLFDVFEQGRSLYQLRAPVGDFVGREDEIEKLKTSLRADGTAAISGVSGMGGIGKTELGLYVANLLREEYPDGQLMVSMRGTAESPRETKDALVACVRAFVGLEAKIPENITEISNLYLSLLKGKRALLYFDNVANGAQISLLRPPVGCGMLITSRSPIALPGINNIHLGQLNPKEAQELLLNIVNGADMAIADRICELCGYLPLAIRAAGSLLATTADLEPVDYANQLHDERTRLEKLGTEGVDISVHASFNLSYARLSSDSATVFKQLAIFPGSFDATAEEFLCRDEDHKHLSDLVRRSLVMYDKDSKRYHMHELMRVFAKSLLSDEETLTSEMRLARYYQNLVKEANHLYLQNGKAHSQGRELINRERENIRHGWAWASSQAEIDEEAAEVCWTYPLSGFNVLRNTFPANELNAWCQKSLSIARHLNNREAELSPLTMIGLLHESIGEYKEAEECLRSALSLAEGFNDDRGAAMVSEYLGRVLADRGMKYEAIEKYEYAKQIWCRLGEHSNEGKIISEIASAYSDLRETHRAIQHLQLVLKNAREDGNKLEEANALANLANVYKKKSKAEAIRFAEQAVEIFEQLGYRHWAAQASSSSGLWLVESGESARGIKRIERAVSILHEIGDSHLEVIAVGQLGEAYMSLNEPQQAIRVFDQQLRIAREIGDRHREANALGDKGIMLVQIGQFDSAVITYNEARHVAQLTGNHDHEFNTLCKFGEAYLQSGKYEEAFKVFEDQIGVARAMGIVSKELHALKHLADLFAEQGDNERAKKYMEMRATVSQGSKDPHDHPESVFDLSIFLAAIGEHDQAIIQAKIAVPLFEQIPDPSCASKVEQQINLWNNERFT
jgi:tetratricopeptide (TPR) repeat protein